MVKDAFLASPHLRNLADRLAHRFQGTSLHAATGPVRARRLVILTDGIGIDAIKANLDRVHVEEIFVIGVGIDEAALSWAFENARFAKVPAEPHTVLWAAAQRQIEGEDPWAGPTVRPKVFLSHGVADEGLIFPALAALREQYGVDPFVCADSIQPGTNWRGEILDHLRRCDVFLLLCSKAVSSSVYCAYEAGMAAGLGKEIRVISIDGGAVPVHLADAQAIDIPRLRDRKPWLTQGDALLDAMLAALLSTRV